MEEKMKVSVVMSVYNHGKEFLSQCLESLHSQNMQKGIEFLIVDNGATVQSKELLAEYEKKDPRFHIIHFEKNMGYAKAVNTAIAQARGEYIAIVESDDFVTPDIYTKLYGRITEFDADVCVAGFYVRIDGVDYEDNPHNQQIFANSDDTKLFSILDYPFLFTTHQSIWAKMYKASFLKQIQFVEEGQYVDSEFIVDLYCRTNKIIALKEPVYHYQCSNPNASQSNARTDASLMRILDNWMIAKRKLQEYGYYKKLKDEFYYQSIKAAYRFYKNIDPQYRRAFYEKWRAFTADLQTDPVYNFKYFNAEQKEFLQNVLRDNYEGTLKYIEKKSAKISRFLEKIASVKNSADGKYKVFSVLGVKIKHKRKRFKKQELLQPLLSREQALYFLQKSNIQAAALHPTTFLPYKGMYQGKAVAIVGSGPSLAYYQPLKEVVHVGVNRSFLKEDLPLDYLFIQDYLKGGEDMKLAAKYRPQECTKFYGLMSEGRYNQVKRTLRKITNRDLVAAGAKPYVLEDAVRRNWANLLEIEPLGEWGGCVFSALQFILYTAPSKIYIIGCDCSDAGHFHAEREEVYKGASLSYQYSAWQAFKAHVDRYYPDVEIVSVNPVGLRSMFKDVYTPAYLQAHSEIAQEEVAVLENTK